MDKRLKDEVFQKDLEAYPDQNKPANDLDSVLEEAYETVTDVNPEKREDKGDDADDRHGDYDWDLEEGEGDTDGQGVDAGGEGQEGEDPKVQEVCRPPGSVATDPWIILSPISTRRPKATQWSYPVTKSLNSDPPNQPITCMKAWKAPKKKAAVKALLSLSWVTVTLLVTDTAKASMARPRVYFVNPIVP